MRINGLFKRFLSMVIAVCIFAYCNFMIYAQEENLEVSNFTNSGSSLTGTCGENITWELATDGTLTLSGTGPMYDYSQKTTPWRNYGQSITKLVISDDITEIGNYAFYNTNISGEIRISDKVTRIGSYAFYDTKIAGTLSFPDGIEIGTGAFQFCENLESVILPNGISSIKDNAFDECLNIKGSLTIPEGVKTIGYRAFCLSGFTEHLSIPDSVEEIGELAFAYAGFKGDLIIPESVRKIGASAFAYCKGFDGKVVIPSSVESINAGVFGYSSNIKMIVNNSDQEIILPQLSDDEWVSGENPAFKITTLANGTAIRKNSEVKSYVVYFNPNGGNVSQDSKIVYYGSTYGKLPTPTRTGYEFDGWYTETESGDRVLANSNVSILTDHTLYAKWTVIPSSDPVNQNQPDNPSQPGNDPNPCNTKSEDKLRDFVERMYSVALSRCYDETGLDDWVSQLKNGTKNGAGIAQGFMESQEFINKNYSNEEYLYVLYHTFFDRDPDADGYRNWLSQLESGASRRHVLSGFVNSHEFTNLCDRFEIQRGTLVDDQDTNSQVIAFVKRMYEKALGRQGEESGINDWTQRIVTGEWTASDVAKAGFFTSPEYTAKNRSNEDFVEDLYQALFDRTSDDVGKADWLQRLANGASRDDIINGFGGSAEFANMLARFGL